MDRRRSRVGTIIRPALSFRWSNSCSWSPSRAMWRASPDSCSATRPIAWKFVDALPRSRQARSLPPNRRFSEFLEVVGHHEFECLNDQVVVGVRGFSPSARGAVEITLGAHKIAVDEKGIAQCRKHSHRRIGGGSRRDRALKKLPQAKTGQKRKQARRLQLARVHAVPHEQIDGQPRTSLDFLLIERAQSL